MQGRGRGGGSTQWIWGRGRGKGVGLGVWRVKNLGQREGEKWGSRSSLVVLLGDRFSTATFFYATCTRSSTTTSL